MTKHRPHDPHRRSRRGFDLGSPARRRIAGLAEPIFVSTDQLDAWSILPNPPADHSPEAAAELAEVHRLQDTRKRLRSRMRKRTTQKRTFLFSAMCWETNSRPMGLPRTACYQAICITMKASSAGRRRSIFSAFGPSTSMPP